MGQVKTRLAREIGAANAVRFYRSTTAAVLARLAADPRWQTWIAVAPDTAVASRLWPSRIGRRPQGGGDLGARMQRVMDWPGAGPVIIVGTDIPGIRPAHIAAAFKQLGHRQLVFGPAEDGGYWLTGQRRTPRILSGFKGVRWSSDDALTDSIASFDRSASAAPDVGFAATLWDVDDKASYERARNWCGRVILPRDGGARVQGLGPGPGCSKD